MNKYYTDEKNAQVVIALLKLHNIKNVILSPGSTNVSIITSLQNDFFFNLFSAVDERSACYMACGLAAELGEPVVISCTGATSSRNYLPGMTEAYYRKLPILALTSTQDISKVGHNIAQVIDRSIIQNDVAKISVTLPVVNDENDFWECEIKVNKAILELFHHGGGPVHINIPTTYNRSFLTKELPYVRKINRIMHDDNFPSLNNKKIGIFLGSHLKFPQNLSLLLDKFCESNNAVVFCDHTSNYKGKFRVLFSLVSSQKTYDYSTNCPDISIFFGEISGDYSSHSIVGNEVWRVNEDGDLRDTFGKLSTVFEMSEKYFLNSYIKESDLNPSNSYLESCKVQIDKIKCKIPELPFSNIWIASKLANKIPDGSIIHFGILNSLRSWNFFELPTTVNSSSNVGGFGIDGGLSSLVGASLANKNSLYFGVIGDLAFFYDMNALGNRHISNNLRILLINNGKGTEFRLGVVHPSLINDEHADDFISAAGHFGNKSPNLVRNYSQDLGFEYFAAKNKSEFDLVYTNFINPKITDKPIFLEVFTEGIDENDALEIMTNLDDNYSFKTKHFVKSMIGSENIKAIKGLFK